MANRPSRRTPAATTKSPLRRWVPHVERLETREVPAITLGTQAQWTDVGPGVTTNGQATNIQANGGADAQNNPTFNNPVIGAVSTVAPVLTNKNVLFAGTPNGGLWRTTNALDPNPVWAPMTDGLASLSISCIDVDPANPNRVIAGIGVKADGSYLQVDGQAIHGDLIGAIYSTNALDANPTWRVLSPTLAGMNVKGVAVRAGFLLALGDRGVFRSTDEGATFTKIDFYYQSVRTNRLNPNVGAVYDLAADPFVTDQFGVKRFYMATSGAPAQNGLAATHADIWRSDDGGISWGLQTDLAQQEIGANTVNIQLSVYDRGNLDNIVYAAVANTNPVDTQSDALGINKETGYNSRAAQVTSVTWSPNQGGNWTRMDTPRTVTDFKYLNNIPSLADGIAIPGSPVTFRTNVPHRLKSGDQVQYFGSTYQSGTAILPTGLDGTYNVVYVDDFTFTLQTIPNRQPVNFTLAPQFFDCGHYNQIVNINPGQFAQDLDLLADPTNNNIVYIGGDAQERPFFGGTNATEGRAAVTYSANIWRGDRLANPQPPSPVTTLAVTNQWAQMANSSTLDYANLRFADQNPQGTAPPADTQKIAFDADGRILYATDAGLYRLPAAPSGTAITGFVYSDRDFDGIKDPDEGGIPGVTLQLYTQTGTAVLASAVTDSLGFYSFAIPVSSAYKVELPSGGLPGSVGDVNDTILGVYLIGSANTPGSTGGVSTVDTNTGYDTLANIPDSTNVVSFGNNFGYYAGATVSGYVFQDSNRNGRRASNEPGINYGGAGSPFEDVITLTGTNIFGIPVNLTALPAKSTTLNTHTPPGYDGYYEFTDLYPGTYTVTEKQPSAFADGGDSATFPGVAVTNDVVSNFVLRGADVADNTNFGELVQSPPAAGTPLSPPTPTPAGFISGHVYVDADDDQAFAYDAGDQPVIGQTVYLYRRTFTSPDGDQTKDQYTMVLSAGAPVTATTDAMGYYQFTGLTNSQTYQVEEYPPANLIQGTINPGNPFGEVAILDRNPASGAYRHSFIRGITTTPFTPRTDNDFGKLPIPRGNLGVWTSLNGATLRNGQFYSVSYDALTGVYFGGTQDTGAPAQTATNSGVYQDMILPDRKNTEYQQFTVLDTEVDNTLLPDADGTQRSARYVVGTNFDSFYRLIYNPDGTLNATVPFAFASPITPLAVGSGLRPLETPAQAVAAQTVNVRFAANQNDPRRGLYGSRFAVYEDSDPNGNIGAQVNDVTVNFADPMSAVSAIYYGGRFNENVYNQVAYVGTVTGQLFFRDFFTTTFVNRAPDINNPVPVTKIVTDPDDYKHIFALKGGRVYETTDTGLNWTDITYNLIGPAGADGTPATGSLSTAIYTLGVYDVTPGNAANGVVLLAGGRGGVYRLLNDGGRGGPAWFEYGNGLPNTVVTDLNFRDYNVQYNTDPTNGVVTVASRSTALTAATFGRGLWSIPDVTTTIRAPITLSVTGSGGDDVIVISADQFFPGRVLVDDGQGNVQSIAVTSFSRIQVNAGAGRDTLIVSSTGRAAGGDLSFVNFGISADMGGDAGDQIFLKASGRTTDARVTIAGNTVGGGTSDTLFNGTAGRLDYVGLAAGTLNVLLGSGNDVFVVPEVAGFLPAGVILDGANGSDAYLISPAVGAVVVRDTGTAGFDTLYLEGTVNADTISVGATSAVQNAMTAYYDGKIESVVVEGQGGVDKVRVIGGAANDVYIVHSQGSDFGVVEGLPVGLTYRATETVDIDGQGGTNSVYWRDESNRTLGTAPDPSTGLVYRPTAAAAGDLRFGGLFTPPVLAISNVNGTFELNADPFANGSRDTLLVLGTSTNGASSGAAYAELTSADGTDFFVVADDAVAVRNVGAGGLRGVSFAFEPGGGPSTLSNLTVRAGNEVGNGDTVNVTPSSRTNIVLDGMNPPPVPGAPGDLVNVAVTGSRSIAQLAASPSGPPQTRVTLDDGRSVGYYNFEQANLGSAGGATSVNNTFFAVGTDAGVDAEVRVFDRTTGSLKFAPIHPFPGFTGGVTVAMGDVTGDGLNDIVVGAGPGGGPQVNVYSGVDGALVRTFLAFEPGFRGGVTVAAGDVNLDGIADIVVGAGAGGGPRVDAFNGLSLSRLFSFFAFEPEFRGGVNVAAGDVDGDGRADIAAGAQVTGAPRVSVFHTPDLRVLSNFFAYDTAFTGGVNVALGDVTGDGRADLITGPGVNGAPQVKVFNAVGGSEITNFFVNEQPTPGTGAVPLENGVRVAAFDANGDGVKDILIGKGSGTQPVARAFSVVPSFGQVFAITAFGDDYLARGIQVAG